MVILGENEWYIQVPWGKLSIIAWGNCLDPPVLLCHGGMDTAVSFRPLVNLLPKNFYYIGVDLPGNGKSDSLPPGLMLNTYDLMYSIEAVAKHFRWNNFVFIAHSLGTLLGKLYCVCYPNKISKLVELDPIPLYHTIVEPENFDKWYRTFFTSYYEKYHIINSPRENAPTYLKEQVIEMIMSNRGIPAEAAAAIADRISESAGHGLVRLTFDQRMKYVVFPPFSLANMQNLYTDIDTPTLAILAGDSVKEGIFPQFALDEKCYPAGNYRVREVPGIHDVHVVHPDRVAPYIAQFLLSGLTGLDKKAKL